jgi:hypothetical protein
MSSYSTKSDYIGASLSLYSNGKFSMESYTCIVTSLSSGIWSKKNDTIILTSTIQKKLPIEVIYLDQAPDKLIKKFAFIRDLKGNEYTHSAIHINSDTVSCFWGDSECFGSYTNIDSIKVVVMDFSSDWIKVDSKKGIIQIIIQTDIGLGNYFPVNLRFKKEKGKLRLIKS